MTARPTRGARLAARDRHRPDDPAERLELRRRAGLEVLAELEEDVAAGLTAPAVLERYIARHPELLEDS